MGADVALELGWIHCAIWIANESPRNRKRGAYKFWRKL
jgi:hypothetical protein